MLDFRLNTFLILAEILNYTETAKVLHISQPAVSQHIRFLEDKYGHKLFDYKDKKLSLTRKGELLYEYTLGIDASSQRIEKLMKAKDEAISIKFGTTLTIGEYTMPKILNQFLLDYPDHKINMQVGNTENLLEKLNHGEIDFALLEGLFDKSKYNTKKLADEEFVGVASPENMLANSKVDFEDLFHERLLIREKGSGSRDIFEFIIMEQNYTMDNFKNKTEIGNINAIKDLVKNNMGISFLYKKAVEKELDEGSLAIIELKDLTFSREYNFVFPKNNIHSEEFLNWFSYFKAINDK